MKPVLVLQHQLDDGPGYFETWLGRHGIPWTGRCAEAGDSAPATLDGFAALAILGGAMSANDELAYLREEEGLIRAAVARDIPVIGHCLGGQLMARALGATVCPAAVPEIGWHAIEVNDGPPASDWFGGLRTATVFQWHFDRFELPPGAVLLAASRHCAAQAFALGPHLAMQFHVEIDARKVTDWVRGADRAYRHALQHTPGSVQSTEEMLAGIGRHLAAHHRLADLLYERWWSMARR